MNIDMNNKVATMATQYVLLCVGIFANVHLFCNALEPPCQSTVQMVARCHGPVSDVTFTKDGRNVSSSRDIIPGIYHLMYDCQPLTMPVIANRNGCQSVQLPGVDALISMNCFDPEGDGCQNGGTCTSLDPEPGYKCDCLEGFRGPNCETNINDCRMGSCLNGGRCIDGVNTFSCMCRVGFTGIRCATNIDDCTSTSCHNGGVCNDGINSHTCTCPSSYWGPHCENNVDDCTRQSCANGGTCIDGISDFTCCCASGFTGATCQENIGDCTGDPCHGNGKCVDLVDSYICNCYTGFAGIHCQDNVDDCTATACANGGTCIDGVNAYTCFCDPGYTGETCQINIENCYSGSCHGFGSCTDGVNSYTCTCDTGYTGTHCQTNVDDCTETTCENGGTCEDELNDFTCYCVPGYTDKTCSTNIEDCTPDSCHGFGACTDGVNSFTCACDTGYTGIHCQTNVDDCTETTCKNGGTCEDGLNDFTCYCAPGYTDDTCSTNINDCTPDPCHNGVCADGVNSFTCTCDTGFAGDHCETNVDDCTGTPCENGGTCIDGVNEFTCYCATGFNGETCQTNIDDCTPDPCHNGACADGVNSFTCTCDTGFAGDHCETNVDDCTTCENGGTCIDGVNAFTCYCASGYDGDTCQTNINDCSPDPCHNGACADGVNSFTCTCIDGFTGDHCEINEDDCTGTTCENGGTCVDGVDEFTCYCVLGYAGDTCQTNINDCTPDPCHNGACADGVNSFTCTCDTGYAGDHCEINIDDCTPDPCHNGACADGVNSFTCTCDTGYAGDHCETNIDDCLTNDCTSEETCIDGIDSYTCIAPDCDALLCTAKWTKVFSTNPSGAVLFGSLAELKRLVASGSDVRIMYSGKAISVQNVKPLNGHVCAQTLFQLDRIQPLMFESDICWEFVNFCTTGLANNARYSVGTSTQLGGGIIRTRLDWFVRPKCVRSSILRITNEGSIVFGSVAGVIEGLKKGHDMRIMSSTDGYIMPADSIEFNTAETEVAAQALWHVSEEEDGDDYILQPNAFWRFAIWSTSGQRKFSRWTVGNHVSRGETMDTEATEWFSDQCWELAYRHDAQGIGQEGSLAALLTAIEEGHRVRVLYKNSIITARELKIRNGHVNAQLVDKVSKQGLDGFPTNVYWDWRIVSTTGSVRTIQYLVGSNAPVGGQTLTTEAISWFVDTLTWQNVLDVAADGTVNSGTKAALVQAIRNGAEVRTILYFSDATVVTETDNLKIAGSEVSAMHVWAIGVTADGSSEVRFENPTNWWFTLALTTGKVEISRWMVGIHLRLSRDVPDVRSTWLIME